MLKIVNEGSSLKIVNEGLSFKNVNETTNYIKTVVSGKTIVFEKKIIDNNVKDRQRRVVVKDR